MVGRRLACRDAAGSRARHLTREHVCQRYVLAGWVTISRAGARHDMRDAVPPCEMHYRGEAGTPEPPPMPPGLPPTITPADLAIAVRGDGGAEKGGRRLTFGCAATPALMGNGVIAPFRDGRSAGRRVKDMRQPPFLSRRTSRHGSACARSETNGADEVVRSSIRSRARVRGGGASRESPPHQGDHPRRSG